MIKDPQSRIRRICFVTGTRAEFGLMHTTLKVIRDAPSLQLQIVATGMHLDPRHGRTLGDLALEGFAPDLIVPWPASSGRRPAVHAANTGAAIADLAKAFHKLQSDVVMVVGDRVEAFAAAAAAHLSQRVVAHVHGGDRALGQVDDSLRHAITKLAHIHFPATPSSASRIAKLGEEKWRIHCVGSPGIEQITELAAPWSDIAGRYPSLHPRRYALLVLHPSDSDERLEYRRARALLGAARKAGFDHLVAVYPNNDPGCSGIMRCWQENRNDSRLIACRNLPRRLFLGLMRDAAVLAGNSSSGIIEAASFQVPVLDIGPRQTGRECSRNVVHCEYDLAALAQHLERFWNRGRPRRIRCRNIYGGDTARRIADILASIPLTNGLLHKLIRY